MHPTQHITAIKIAVRHNAATRNTSGKCTLLNKETKCKILKKFTKTQTVQIIQQCAFQFNAPQDKGAQTVTWQHNNYGVSQRNIAVLNTAEKCARLPKISIRSHWNAHWNATWPIATRWKHHLALAVDNDWYFCRKFSYNDILVIIWMYPARQDISL